MRVLITAALFVITLCTLAICLSLLIGSRQAAPTSVAWLHLTDCAPPCWNGITSRISSRGAAENRMNATFPLFNRQSVNNLPALTWAQDDLYRAANTTINLAIDDATVTSMGIATDFPTEQMPSLGEMLAVFGLPTCVAIDRQSGYSILNYENAAHQVVLQYTVLPTSLFAPITNLSIGISYNLNCQNLFGISWHEFRVSQSSSHLAF